jgi:phosphate-selective porin OprO and OprP
MTSRPLLPIVAVLLFAWPAWSEAQPAGQSRPAEGTTKENEEEAAKSKKKKEELGFRWDDHPSLRLGRGTQVDFRLRLQGDVRASDAALPDRDPGDDGFDGLDVARRRVGLDGEILNLFDYQVERELAEDNDPWRDVYLNYKQFRFAQVQGGKFKMPFSMDENTSPTNLDFIYRSRAASLLAPGRDRGLMFHGRLFERARLGYEVGVFEHDGANARTNNPDRVNGNRTIAGRVVVQPLRQPKSLASDFQVGVAFTRGDVEEGVSGIRGRTVFDNAFYRPYFWVNGERRRLGIEARWRPGPFSLKSEYIRLTDERRGLSVEDSDLSPFIATGWYASGTWAITGEPKADGLASPRRPLFQGGFGAVELAARVEGINFGSIKKDGIPSLSPRSDVLLSNSSRVYTIGVNWYANRWVKMQANVVRETFTDPEQGPAPSQTGYWSRSIRCQFSM